MDIKYEQLMYQGWTDCHRLSNGLLDIVVSGGFGPRILRCGLVGHENLFVEQYEEARSLPDSAFKLVGGHRLWHAPENIGRTYVPDNGPVRVNYADGVLSLMLDAEPVAQVEKALEISLDPSSARVIVTHTLTNRSVWPVELAVWALSVMAPGGTAALPLPPRAGHGPDGLLPASTLVMWPYTDFSDPRWEFARRAVLLHGDPTRLEAQKLGAPVPDGWLAYWHAGTTFIKRFDYEPGARYADGGSSAELFTNGLFLELESLSPLVRLEPGESAEHVEQWDVTRDLPAPDSNDMQPYFDWIDQND